MKVKGTLYLSSWGGIYLSAIDRCIPDNFNHSDCTFLSNNIVF